MRLIETAHSVCQTQYHIVWATRLRRIILSGFDNPLLHIFDYEEYEKGILKVAYSIPYSDIESLPKDELKRQLEARESLEFGYTLEDQIKGQIDAGFIISEFYEDNSADKELLDRYINTFMASKAEKVYVDKG